MYRWYLFFLAALSLSGGQSLHMLTGYAANHSIPIRSHSLPSRVEMYLHDWSATLPAYSRLANVSVVGYALVMYNHNGKIYVNYSNQWEVGGSVCSVEIDTLADKAVYLRFQHDPANKADYCEAWDRNGNRFYNLKTSYTSEGDNPDIGAALWGDDRSIAFLRIHSTLVPVNSRTPVTADNSDVLLHWKFDGSLDDSSGNGYHATLSGGSPAYVTTPFQNPTAVVKTAVAPVWSSWSSLRAGFPAQLDGTASVTQADSSATVTCFWQALSGPSYPAWDDRSSCSPTVTGLIFGDYLFQLTVTDADGQTATQSLRVGAVSTDDKGVVVNADPNVDAIFGPMMAWGHSPWGFTDERALSATRLRKAVYETPNANGYSIANPSFIHYGEGTISYTEDGIGNPQQTSITSPINSTDTTIVVANTSALDLTGPPGVPTRVCLGEDVANNCTTYGTVEEVRICSVSGNTLTVCYDGRGQNAKSWATGTKVGQYKITGTATKFVTDAAVPICPGGAPGPAGRVIYSTGRVTMTHGSVAVLGSGTTWNSTNGVAGGSTQWLRVEATHGSGTPFIFWAYIGTLNDSTHLTLGREYPATADDGTFNYKIIEAGQRYWGLGYTRADASSTTQLYLASGCESETAGYALNIWHSPGTGTAYTGKVYTYQDTLGYRSAFGHNFYGEGLAHRALYYRSGLTEALTAANEVDDNWLRAPEVTTPAGWVLNWGGAMIASYTNVLLNPSAKITWNDLRPYATYSSGAFGIGCNVSDSRDQGYLQGVVALSALFDPDVAIRSTWKSVLVSALGGDQNCKGTDNSWASSAGYWFGEGPVLTLTNGSATVTGTGLTTSNTGCTVTAMGTGTATNGSATLTGTGFTSGSMIVVTGTRSGAPYSGFYQYSGTSSPLTLSALWPGDSGAITWAISSSDGISAIGTSNADTQLRKNWVCRLDSPTQLTLHRAWDGSNTSSARIRTTNIAGFGQQPFMLGIKTKAMKWSSLVDDPTVSAGYAALLPLAADWMYTTGYDPSTQGLHYARVFGACEPYPTAPPLSSFSYRQVGCNNGFGAIESARTLTAEASSSLWAKYEAVTTPTVKTWADTAYGSIWGNASYTTEGVYADSNYVKYLLSDAALGNFKWTGFFFGMGMAHQWPAARLGGVAPAIDRSISVNFSLASVPNATQFQIILTKPSGAQIVQACPTSPCVITGDARQGAHLMRWRYLDSSARVLAQSDPTIIAVPYPDARPASGPLDSLDGRKVPGINRDKHSHRAFIQSPADPPSGGQTMVAGALRHYGVKRTTGLNEAH